MFLWPVEVWILIIKPASSKLKTNSRSGWRRKRKKKRREREGRPINWNEKFLGIMEKITGVTELQWRNHPQVLLVRMWLTACTPLLSVSSSSVFHSFLRTSENQWTTSHQVCEKFQETFSTVHTHTHTYTSHTHAQSCTHYFSQQSHPLCYNIWTLEQKCFYGNIWRKEPRNTGAFGTPQCLWKMIQMTDSFTYNDQ